MRLVVGCLVVLLLASAVPAGGTVSPDSVVLRADVEPDGTAEWTIEHRIRLDDENTTEAFEELRSGIRNDTTVRDRFRERMTATVADAANATGREMRLEDVRVTAETRQLPQTYGVVIYQFGWTGFAATDDNRLLVGDALGGFFLDNRSQLTVTWPDGYEPRTASPEPVASGGDRMTWRGPTEFDADGPRLVLDRSSGTADATDGNDNDGTGDTDQTDARLLDPLVGAGALLALAALLGGTALAVRRRGDTAGEPDAAPTGLEAHLLSSEERVLRLVDERGGRIKQREIADALDWSDARASQVVADLREREAVETYRVGRENVVACPDEDDT